MPFGGGVEKYSEEVGCRLIKKGHDVNVYIIKHFSPEKKIYKGMNIIKVPALKTKILEKLSATVIAAIIAAFNDSSDIIHFHAFGPGMFCAIPKLLGKKVVVQGHGLEWKRSRWNIFGRWFLKATEWPSVKFPDGVTVVSRVQQRYLKEKYGIESFYIPTGVNPPRNEKPDLIRNFFGLEGNDYILFAARLVKEKGAHYLIEAYNRLKPRIKLVIAGDSYHEDKYKAFLNKLKGKNKNIIFTGYVTGKVLRELFSNCYMFVLPSEIEGLPTALLEAMSYGNCCLVSNIPENLEALNGYGFYFNNRDVENLAERINYLIENPEIVKEIREQAKSYVLSNFNWDVIANKMEEFYLKILNGGS